ncbi:MAG TPA: ATP12 family protein [Xanthobacteraceae bacterium]|jgi:chaperone required for assembly of F1-ATPase
MRELFEDISGHSPLDPQESARQSARVPLRKRFYQNATFTETPDGFAVMLDDKQVRTPSREPLVVPTRDIAQAIVDEWNAQVDVIDPTTMPVTRLANSVIAGVVDRVDDVAEDAAKYLHSDLLFYRASHPDALIAREAEHWDPVLDWARDDLGAHFIMAEGIMHVRQPDQAIAAVRAAFPSNPWAVGALHVATTVTGSALLALALMHGTRDVDQVWAAANVGEDWNAAQWGADEEAMARRASRLRDLRAAALVLGAKPATA